MEGGSEINPSVGFDIASMLGKLTNAKSPTKSMIGEPTAVAAINQQIRDIISHYASVASTSAASPAAPFASTSVTGGGLCAGQPLTGASGVSGEEGQAASTSALLPSGEVAHGEEDCGEAKSRGTRQIHCSECPRVLLSRKNFIKHAEDEHGMVLPIIYKNFYSQQDFDKWISYLREERNTEFVSKCGRKRLSNGSLLGYLVCAKSGSEAWKSRKKTAKSLKTCSAYLKVLRNETTGRIEIEGCLDHTGHEFSLVPVCKGDDLEQNGEGWIGEGVPFSEVCAQIEARRVGEASYLNCQQPGDVQVDVLTSNSLDPSTNPNAESMLTNFLSMLKHKPNVVRPHQQLTPDNTASSSTEVVTQKTISSLAVGKTLNNTFVNVELERRKLALLEQFQTTIRQISEQSIDGAEVAMKFFLREMDSLNKSSDIKSHPTNL